MERFGLTLEVDSAALHHAADGIGVFAPRHLPAARVPHGR